MRIAHLAFAMIVAPLALGACGAAGVDVSEEALSGTAPTGGNLTAVCHLLGNGESREIEVQVEAVPALLAHGDYLGPCVGAAAAAENTLVCHNGNEIEVASQAVPALLQQGDYLGPCVTANSGN